MSLPQEEGGAGGSGDSGVRAEFSSEAIEAAQQMVSSIEHQLAAAYEQLFALAAILRSHRRRDPASRGKVVQFKRRE